MIRVAIVDDHTMVREGLKRIIEQEPDVRVVAEAVNAAGATSLLEKQNIDVMILDVSLPDKNGIEAAKEIRRNHKVPILILSMHPEELYGVRAMQAGASSYLTKSASSEELITAIRHASRGRRYIPSSLGQVLAEDAARGGFRRTYRDLSDRELEIMLMIAGGNNRAEIAEKLHLSPETVSTYRRRILHKLGLSTSVEVFRYAVENGLIGRK